MFHILPKRKKLNIWIGTALMIIFVLYIINYFMTDDWPLILYYIMLVPIFSYTDYVNTTSKYLYKINDQANIPRWEHKSRLWTIITIVYLLLGIIIYSLLNYQGFGINGHISATIGFIIISLVALYKQYKEPRSYTS